MTEMNTKQPTPTVGKPAAPKTHQTNAKPPRVKISKNEFSIDHPDRKLGEEAMMKSLGANNRDFMLGMLKQLVNAKGQEGNETDVNFMIAAVIDIKPRDHVEAMLAAQMASVHVLTMRFANYLGNTDNLYQQDSAERVFSKLTRTFPAQMEALKRYRSSGEQSVTVQNVSVQDGGQAIVGNVTQHSGVTPLDEGPASPPVITDAHTIPMPIVGEQEQDVVAPQRKSRS
jgi:hypothetical protein